MTNTELCKLLEKIEYTEFAFDNARSEESYYRNAAWQENNQANELDEHRGYRVSSTVSNAKQQRRDKAEEKTGKLFLTLSVLLFIVMLLTKGDTSFFLLLFTWILFEVIGYCVFAILGWLFGKVSSMSGNKAVAVSANAAIDQKIALCRYNFSVLNARADRLTAEMSRLSNELQSLYGLSGLYYDYRNVIAAHFIRECLEAGVCTSLTGPFGAYAKYQEERRANRICSCIMDLKRTVMASAAYIGGQINGLRGDVQRMENGMNRMRTDINNRLSDISNSLDRGIISLDELNTETRKLRGEISSTECKTNAQLSEMRDLISRTEYNTNKDTNSPYRR